uniref:Myb/SANT-like DNA-binding domain-containing protein n=1 Tax=Cacopsylla melanoneura TaxID=428564 RepID=A0A8D9E737_9HEMI
MGESFWLQSNGDGGDVGTLLIEIVHNQQYQNMFKQKKKKKYQIWNLIAQDLADKGFKVPSNNPGQACDQKFRNMIKSYKKFIEKSNKTGSGPSKPPRYFDVLHPHLSRRQDVSPPESLSSLPPSLPVLSSPTHPLPGASTTPTPLTSPVSQSPSPSPITPSPSSVAPSTSSLTPSTSSATPSTSSVPSLSLHSRVRTTLKPKKVGGEEMLTYFKSRDEETDEIAKKQMTSIDSLNKNLD